MISLYKEIIEKLKDETEKTELYMRLEEAHCLNYYSASKDNILFSNSLSDRESFKDFSRYSDLDNKDDDNSRELIGIEVMDHIIIGDGVYFSFKENRII